MYLKKAAIIVGLLSVLFVFEYCSKKDVIQNQPNGTSSPDLPTTPFNYVVNYPAYLQNAMQTNDNTPAGNIITNEGATLGRVLFYDKQLSKNNTISCGSCHKPASSFSDELIFSKGFEDSVTTRHSMPLLNIAYYRSGKMFWDERAPTLEAQVLQPIQNHIEMGLTITELVDKVKAQAFYPALFQQAFGSTTIDTITIARALAQFVRSIVPYQSKYDQVKQGLATFTALEQAGEQLFLNAAPPGNPALTCAGCHQPPLFVTSTPLAPFGLADANDAGINNSGNFKVGTLRNIALTAPYFHNGSVPSLQALLSTNIPAHSVAPQDVQRILAFMQTLSDPTTVAEERFADPFK